MRKVLCLVLVLVTFFSACTSSDEDGGTSGDNFDRKAMLANLADNIIIPSYQKFSVKMTDLKNAASSFVTSTNEENLITLREAWTDAYVFWQYVNMYEIGKAEELSYRNFMNVYPVNTTDIDTNINSGSYDLTAVSKQDEQGFGALDYMINGLSDTDAGIVGLYADSANGTKYKDYLTDVVDRMDALTKEIVADWTNGNRDIFVNNSGSSATSSVDKIVNDFIFHYEKHLRAGKIGIPAGIFAQGKTFEDKVEAFYKGDLSRLLFLINLDAMQNFFNGQEFEGIGTGESFRTYLSFLNTIKGGQNLGNIINEQFDVARNTAMKLDESFSSQIKSNNNLMLNTYDELQKNVVHMKVDMVQAFSISIDFVDADGD